MYYAFYYRKALEIYFNKLKFLEIVFEIWIRIFNSVDIITKLDWTALYIAMSRAFQSYTLVDPKMKIIFEIVWVLFEIILFIHFYPLKLRGSQKHLMNKFNKGWT